MAPTALIALMTFPAFAQVRIGPEAGLNLAFMDRKVQVDNVPYAQGSKLSAGFRAGMALDVRLMMKFYIQSGLFFDWDHVKFKEEVDLSAYSLPNEWLVRTKILNYLQMPLLFTYKSASDGMDRFFVGAGPYARYAIGGKKSANKPFAYSEPVEGGVEKYLVGWKDTEQKLRWGNEAGVHDYRRWDWGGALVLGFESCVGLYFKGYYYHGFANIRPGKDANDVAKNWSMGITMGVLLGKDTW